MQFVFFIASKLNMQTKLPLNIMLGWKIDDCCIRSSDDRSSIVMNGEEKNPPNIPLLKIINITMFIHLLYLVWRLLMLKHH